VGLKLNKMKNTTTIGVKTLFLAAGMMLSTFTINAQIQKGLDIDGLITHHDYSGGSVSMPNTNFIAIGAPRYNYFEGQSGLPSIPPQPNGGSVRVYGWDGTAWNQKGADMIGQALGNEFGGSVSMPDGNTVAVGARFNSSNGGSRGHVRVYTWRGSSWVQRGVDIDGEAALDRSGYSVSMPDGNTVAIGAPKNSNSFSSGTQPMNSGHARVYSLICGDSLQLQPQSYTSSANSGLANFKCKSTDTAAGYQWQENIGSGWSNLTNQGIYSGTASDSLILTSVTPSMNNYSYRCLVYSCSGDTSDVALLYVTCPDSLKIQPQNFTAFSSIGLAHFMCKSTDTAAGYQWQENIGSGWSNLINLGNYTGVMVDSLVISGVTSSMNNYGYRCIVTSGCMTDTSGIAYLTVVDDLGFGESKLNKLSISPNPTNGIMTLNVEFVGTYELLTVDGRVLEYGKARQEYDLSAYPKAVYNLRLSTDEGVRVLKVVKN
jgi:hypothetical protein